MNDEKIICAAVWYPELPLIKPHVLEPRGFRPYNIDKGVVICGWRHANCIYTKVAITGLADHETGDNVQGFLTNKNRFVDREEAAIIALRQNQIIDMHRFNGIDLFSEDIY